MDCNKANELMMKYMDKELSEEDAEVLRKHILSCDTCHKDFLMYDSILEEFSNLDNVIVAPINFEIEVMAKINGLGEIYPVKESSNERFLYKLWGSVSVVCGAGMLLILNRDSLINLFLNNPKLASYTKYFEPVQNYVIAFKNSFNSLIGSITGALSIYIDNIKYISLVAFVILVIAQVIIYKKDKVEA